MENSGEDYVVVFLNGGDDNDLNGLEFTKVHRRNLKEVTSKAPNGGYGWVVALASFLICFLLTGFPKAFGGVKSAILVEYPDTTKRMASWLPSLIGTLTLIFSPVAGSLIRRFGSAKMVFTGGILCCIGFVVSAFATSAGFLVASLGVCLGVGSSLASNAIVACIAKHFTTLKPTAMAIALSGGCAGAVALPFVIDSFLPLLGLKITFFILAALFSLVWILSFLFKDLGTVLTYVRSDESLFDEISDEVIIRMGGEEEVQIPKWKKIWSAVSSEFGLNYFTDLEFNLTCSAAVVMALASPTFLHCITHHAAAAGFSLSQAFCLTSVLAVRLTYGFLAPYSPVPRAVEYAAAIVVSTVAVIALPFCSAYGHFVAATMIAAFGAGIWGMLVPLVLGSNFGAANIGKTFALLRFFQGLAKIVYPLVLSTIQALHGDQGAYVVNAFLMCLGAVVAICLAVVVWRKRAD